jgi:hypothetical protein
MKARRPVLFATIVAVGLAWPTSSSAGLPKCGVKNPKTGRERAALTLDSQSDTTAVYKRKTGKRTLSFIFTASGCDLGTTQPDPAWDVLPKQDADELPDGAVTFKKITPDGKNFRAEFTVDSAKFDPGSYGGIVELRAPYLVTNRVPIVVSRSDPRERLPLLIGAVAGLIAVAWFALTKAASREELAIPWWWVIFVLLAGSAFGAFAVWASWLDQDVWTWSDNKKAAILAGISGATTGSMATILGVVWKAKAP